MNVNGSALFYIDVEGEKPPIVLVHGLSGNHKQMHFIQHAFAGHRLIVIDVKGRGNSGKPNRPSSYTQHGDDIVALLDALHIEQPILLGFSMGAFILSYVATRIKASHLVLIDGAADVSEHQAVRIEPSIARLNKTYDSAEQYIDELRGIYEKLGVTWSAPLEESARYEIEERDGRWHTKADAAIIAEDFESLRAFDSKRIFQEIDCPIFVVHCEGKLDDAPLFLAEHFAGLLTTAKHVEKMTTTANHYTIACEMQEDVMREVRRFLER